MFVTIMVRITRQINVFTNPDEAHLSMVVEWAFLVSLLCISEESEIK